MPSFSLQKISNIFAVLKSKIVMVMDVKRNEITFTSYISNRARRVKVVASRPDAAVVWFFWTGPIVNLEAGHRP
jgi:hypothetical protein